MAIFTLELSSCWRSERKVSTGKSMITSSACYVRERRSLFTQPSRAGEYSTKVQQP
jgi:hypothetical protein